MYLNVRECFLKLGAWPENLTVRLSAFMINGNSPVSLAKSIDCVTSGVANDGNFDCVASKQGNKCLDCRACWDKNVENIGYPAH